MHAPSHRPWLALRALPAAGLGLLLVLVGCDWHFPDAVPGQPDALDLSGLSEDLDGWKCRRADAHLVPPPRLEFPDSTPLLVISSQDGKANRWRRKVRWDAESHPILTWTWSPGRKVDSSLFSRNRSPSAVLAVDVTLASAFGFHKTVRYIWSARHDRGSSWASRDNWHPKVIALRDVRDPIDSLVTERVDVWKDFIHLWGFAPRHQALAIIVSVLDPSPTGNLEGRFGSIVAHPLQETP
ncbi:MAG: DUF3047 domain-containing protein [Fibrobacteria bacterium]|nr:DUF3047 domain-containing protein [Fibrobacteria bacterium]